MTKEYSPQRVSRRDVLRMLGISGAAIAAGPVMNLVSGLSRMAEASSTSPLLRKISDYQIGGFENMQTPFFGTTPSSKINFYLGKMNDQIEESFDSHEDIPAYFKEGESFRGIGIEDFDWLVYNPENPLGVAMVPGWYPTNVVAEGENWVQYASQKWANQRERNLGSNVGTVEGNKDLLMEACKIIGNRAGLISQLPVQAATACLYTQGDSGICQLDRRHIFSVYTQGDLELRQDYEINSGQMINRIYLGDLEAKKILGGRGGGFGSGTGGSGGSGQGGRGGGNGRN